MLIEEKRDVRKGFSKRKVQPTVTGTFLPALLFSSCVTDGPAAGVTSFSSSVSKNVKSNKRYLILG